MATIQKQRSLANCWSAITAASLLISPWPSEVSCAGIEPSQGGPVVSDAGFRNACGPIACYVAARSLGVDTSLDDIVDACDWREGQTTNFAALLATMSRFHGVESQAVRLSPTELERFLAEERGVAILPVRKNAEDINHAVCVVGTEESHLRIVDFPELEIWYHVDEIRDIWDGEAILVQPSHRRTILLSVIWGTFPGALIGGAAGILLGRRGKKTTASS